MCLLLVQPYPRTSISRETALAAHGRNVSRCWTYETARLLDQHISDNVPWHEYMDYYGPDYKLHVPVSNMENNNTRASLEKTKVIRRHKCAISLHLSSRA